MSLVLLAGLHLKRKANSLEHDERKINHLLDERSGFSLQHSIDFTNVQIRSMRETGIADYHEVKKEKNYVLQDRAIDAIIHKANQKIIREVNYANLIWRLAFSFCFFFMQSFQGDITSSYELESSAQTTMINKLASDSGLQYGSSLFADRGTLTSNANFYSWLNSSVLGSIFAQPICGVGKM
jgi:hypothetical protein